MLENVRPSEDDRPREECGLFGIYFPHPSFPEQIVKSTLSGLLANQHRGEESAGVLVANGQRVSEVFKRMGLVRNLFQEYLATDKETKEGLKGHVSISHTRYSTTGSSKIENAAPFLFASPQLGSLGVVHNGNITNTYALREELHHKGFSFTSTTDSEVIGALVVDSQGTTWDEKIINALGRLEGSFSLLMITKDALYGLRDPLGNRPLSYAEFESDGIVGYGLSSETPAFTNLGIRYRREVEPGELIKFDRFGTTSRKFSKDALQAFCGLEVAYLMRPDSRIKEIELDTIRRHLGRILAQNYPSPKDIDFVTYIPESSRPTSEGFTEELSKVLGRQVFIRTSMIKGRYGTIDGVIRGFISPKQENRDRAATTNYYSHDWLNGKKVVVVDDSIIRGTTTRGVIEILRKRVDFLKGTGVAQVHLRIIFPPVVGVCFLGTDINEKDHLIAEELAGNIGEIAKDLNVDSLAYLSPKQFTLGVKQLLGENFGLCMGCTTGNYPVKAYQANKEIFE